MTTYAEPNCFKRRCIHFKGIVDGKYTCEAFPKDIPDDITFGPSLHIIKRHGDHGIQYEKDEQPVRRLPIEQ